MAKLQLWILSLVFVAVVSTVNAEPPLGIRCYNTNYGELQLVFIPNKVIGIYAYGGGGVVLGDLKDTTLTAVWTEPTATKYPSTGDSEFTFNKDFSSFTGRYKFSTGDKWMEWSGQQTSCGSAGKPR